MAYSSEARLRERRAQKSIADWIDEWEVKLENLDGLSEHQRSLIFTCCRNELCDIVEMGLERIKLKFENR